MNENHENLLPAYLSLKNDSRSSPNGKEITEKRLKLQKGKNIGMGKNRNKYNRVC